MAYVALAKIKKNSPPAALTSDITNSTGTFPVDHLEYFHDADGVLIVDGIVIWDPADPDPTHREEVKITAASGTTGAGNLTGGTRGVNADGTNGAARAFSSGAKIAVQFTTGKMNQIADNFAAHETTIAGKATDNTVFHKATAGEIAALTEKTIPVSADVLVIEDSAASNAKKKVQVGNLPYPSSWHPLVATTDFATTAPGTNTITMNTDQTGNIKVGFALKYTYNGTTYYGIVSAITSSLITFSGPAISTGAGLLTAISWGDLSHVRTQPILYVGYWNDGTNTQILAQKFGIPGHWKLGPAYLAQIGYQVNTIDSGATQPTLNFAVNGNNVLTSAVTPTASYQVTGGIISSTYYAITNGQTFDAIVASDGTNKNSWSLWVDTIWVLP